MNMVRRLRVDSNRDIQRSLRHIHLADDSSPDQFDRLLLSSEQQQLSELIQKSISSNNSQEVIQLERTRELLGYVQAGTEKLITKESPTDR